MKFANAHRALRFKFLLTGIDAHRATLQDLRPPPSDLASCNSTLYGFSMKVELDIPDSALSALRQAPAEFAACLRLMAAAKLYETGNLSQERAAELAGQSRQDFVLQLSRLGVSPFQGVEEDLGQIGSLP